MLKKAEINKFQLKHEIDVYSLIKKLISNYYCVFFVFITNEKCCFLNKIDSQ